MIVAIGTVTVWETTREFLSIFDGLEELKVAESEFDEY